MADFCAQCSEKLGAPEGWSDFGLNDEKVKELCEGCGWVEIVGGRCVDKDCFLHRKELIEEAKDA